MSLKLLNKSISPIAFLTLFKNADSFYVLSRIALLGTYSVVGFFLAHQAIELFVKAVVRVTKDSPTETVEFENWLGKKGHDLVSLMKTHNQESEECKKILQDKELCAFLENLTVGYKMRYGEAGFSASIPDAISKLDKIVWLFRREYFKKIRYTGKLYVDESLKSQFLLHNEFFAKEDLTSDLMATVMLTPR